MPLNIALVGVGHMGRIHLDKMASFEGVHVTGIVDAEPDTAQSLSVKYGIPWYTNYAHLPEPIDGVIIATPTDSHYETAAWFLRRKVHVFLEKPIASRLDDAKKLIDLAKEQGCIFQIGHLERFNPAFKGVLPLLRKPLILEASRIGPFTGRSTDVDVVHDLMIHDIDLVASIVKARPLKVQAQGIAFFSKSYDMASARIEFADNSIATLVASRMSIRRERTLTIYERDRFFFLDLMKGSLVSVIENSKGEKETATYEAEKLDSVKDELTEFINSLRGTEWTGWPPFSWPR